MENFIIFAVLIASLALLCILLGQRGAKELAARLLPALIREAEAAFDANCGAEKMEAVLSRFRAALPPLLRPLLSAASITRLIEETISAMRALGDLHPVKEEGEE